jgi:hypothetical protein
MQISMKDLLSYFHDEIGISLPRIALPSEELIHSGGIGYISEDLFGSPSAMERKFLLQGDIKDFISSEDKGYFLIGLWGYGVNSYAFYYSRIDEWSHLFFRLPYGGVYSDIKKDKTQLRKFLKNYFHFELELKLRAKSMVAIDSMGHGEYKIELLDGRIVQLNESFLHDPDFGGRFNHLLTA